MQSSSPGSAGFPVPLAGYKDSQSALLSSSTTGGSESVLYTPASLPTVGDATRSVWMHVESQGTDPLAREGSETDLANEADVCIIGSGMTGVSVLYHLAKLLNNKAEVLKSKPVRVVMLDARDFCALSPTAWCRFISLNDIFQGSGATGESSGQLGDTIFIKRPIYT